MKRINPMIALAAVCISLTYCASPTNPTQAPIEPGQGALSLAIDPNPIVAVRVSGDTYRFPFDIRISNPGILPVQIEEVGMEVTALGGLPVHSESMTASEIEARGYPSRLAAGETLSYHFEPTEEVPDDRIFGGVSAVLTVTGGDSSGKRITSSERVSVTR